MQRPRARRSSRAGTRAALGTNGACRMTRKAFSRAEYAATRGSNPAAPAESTTSDRSVPCPAVRCLRYRNLAQRLLEHLRRLATGDQVPPLDDDRRHAADTGLDEEAFGLAHLGGAGIRGQDLARALGRQPDRGRDARQCSMSAMLQP